MDKFVLRGSSSTPDLATSSSKRSRDDVSDHWQHPKRFATRKPVPKGSYTATDNRFSSLSVDKHNEVSESFKSASKKKTPGRVPPIIIELREEWTHLKLKEIIEKYDKNYHLEYRGNNQVKIQCYSPAAHQAVKDGLLTENVSFHTFTRKDEKLPKVVIKGLPANLLDTLTADLENLGFPGATATHIKTVKPIQCPPILVQLPTGTDMVKFRQIKYIANCVVVIQRYKSNTKIGTQCYRCQGFGHASRNCNRPARCVKCSLAHPTSECPKQGFIESVCCCNCQLDHPANFSQCKERLKYIERIKSKREPLRNIIATGKGVKKSMPVAVASEDLTYSYATATRKSQQSSGVSKSQELPLASEANRAHVISTTLEADVQSSLSPPHDRTTAEMLQILATIKALKQEFVKCESFVDKVILILTHVGQYV